MQVLVVPHPYHASGLASQVVVLDSVPAGAHRLAVWYTAAGPPDTLIEVRVRAGETSEVTARYVAEGET